MSLYSVTVKTVILVEAESNADARRVAYQHLGHHVSNSAAGVVDRVATEITDALHIPLAWRGCLPYRDGTSERTVEQCIRRPT